MRYLSLRLSRRLLPALPLLLGLMGARPAHDVLAHQPDAAFALAQPFNAAGTPVAAATGVHALLAPTATRMGNDADRLAVHLTLLDGADHPLAGKRVALTPSASFADPGPPAVTTADGTATFQVGIRPSVRHTGQAAGPVALSAVDLSDSAPLTSTVQITVYNRVAVLLAGLGTALTCTAAKCYDRTFASLSADALAPMGYNLNGDGLHRTELEYSYRGGSMIAVNGLQQWQIRPYTACDTVQGLDRSEASLRTLLQSYRARYPYTTFELIGHSLGGLVALEGLAGDGGAFLRSLGPAAVDKIITIDSPVNGINQRLPTALLADLAGSVSYLRPCSAQLYGAYLVARLAVIGHRAPGLQDKWVGLLHGMGVDVLTMTNSDDRAVPEPFAVIDPARPTATADRARYRLGTMAGEGHGALLVRTGAGGKPNPAWPDMVAIVRLYLSDTCSQFAPPGSACPYPTINRGF